MAPLLSILALSLLPATTFAAAASVTATATATPTAPVSASAATPTSTSTADLPACYNSPGSLTSAGTDIYQSHLFCRQTCAKQDKEIAGLQGSECFCGDEPPPASTKVDDSKCSTPCPGYPDDTCGGTHVWTVISVDAEPWELQMNLSAIAASISVAASLNPTAVGTAITVAGDAPPATGVPVSTPSFATPTPSADPVATVNGNSETASNSTLATSSGAAGSMLLRANAGAASVLLAVAAALVPFLLA
ncbi:hypothetical protein M432DRAFT_338948 [Thermoascus aurantiacus ATCC 26904]